MFCLCCTSALATGDSGYETPLPPLLSSDPGLCAHVACKEVLPGADSFTLRDLDYLSVYKIEVAGVPPYRESASFIVRSPLYSAAYPWRLVLLANKVDNQMASRIFVNFDQEYWLPDRHLVDGRPKIEKRVPPREQALKSAVP